MQSTIAVVSGGLDSVTLAHYLADVGQVPLVLSFDYGQRHAKELAFAQRCAGRIGAMWECVDLRSVQRLLSGSALTDNSVDVPLGHYASPTMRSTIVPNRNAIMLAIAFGVAAASGADAVGIAVHAGDHPVYPDCRPEFIAAFEAMERIATAGYASLALLAPFVHKSKADIVSLGDSLGVPFGQTWSCYQGHDLHCGRCGTCVERKEAFLLAQVPDPTEYA